MDIQFYIDPETGYPHIHRHGVEEYEVKARAAFRRRQSRRGR